MSTSIFGSFFLSSYLLILSWNFMLSWIPMKLTCENHIDKNLYIYTVHILGFFVCIRSSWIEGLKAMTLLERLKYIIAIIPFYFAFYSRNKEYSFATIHSCLMLKLKHTYCKQTSLFRYVLYMCVSVYTVEHDVC